MDMESYDVVSVGSATLDLFIRSDKFKVIRSSEVPGGVAMCEVYGGKMEVDEVVIASGGGATNTAVSFARKDLKTAVVAEMGNDPAALIVHKELEEAGVDTRFLVQEPDETTAVSTILIAEDGGRSIIVYRGASAMLEKGDFPFERMKTRWLHVTSLGGNIRLLKDLFSWAKQARVRVSFNPGMKEIRQRSKLLPLLPMVEILFVNRGEAQALFDVDYCEKATLEKTPPPRGPYVTMITDGARGGVVCEADACSVYDPYPQKTVVDTTGAGDAFASGVVSGVLYGLSYSEAVAWGARNAASVISKIGAKPGLLTLAEVR